MSNEQEGKKEGRQIETGIFPSRGEEKADGSI